MSTMTKYLKIGDKQVAFDDTANDGPLVICLPGMGDLRSEYRKLIPILHQAGYRVVSIDVRGFGETSATWDDYSAAAVGDDAIALIDHLGAESAIIMGNSFAAGSALWAAHKRPEMVKGTVLLCPILRDPKISLAIKAVLAIGFAGFWRVWFWMTYWDSLFPTSKPSDHAQVRKNLEKNLREPGRMSALKIMLGLSKSDTEAILPSCKAKSLAIYGDRDVDFTDVKAEARWLADSIGAETMIVEGAGHYPHVEMPDKIQDKVLAFLKEASTS